MLFFWEVIQEAGMKKREWMGKEEMSSWCWIMKSQIWIKGMLKFCQDFWNICRFPCRMIYLCFIYYCITSHPKLSGINLCVINQIKAQVHRCSVWHQMGSFICFRLVSWRSAKFAISSLTCLVPWCFSCSLSPSKLLIMLLHFMIVLWYLVK